MFEWCWTIKELYKFKPYALIMSLSCGISFLGLPIIPTMISTWDDTKETQESTTELKRLYNDVFVTMTLVRVEPEETFGGLSAHDIIWNGSFSVTRGVFKYTNHRSANRLLSNALFSLIAAPKTRYLKKYTLYTLMFLPYEGASSIRKRPTTSEKWNDVVLDSIHRACTFDTWTHPVPVGRWIKYCTVK